MKVTGETKLLGFFGSTYKTSKMYAMYNAAIEALGINYIYVPFDVKDIKTGLEAVKALGIHAVGLTIPYKIETIPYLDELDEESKRIGSVNVVINKNGKLYGGNTDGLGALKALKEKTDVKNKKVLLLGSGGTTRSIMFALKDEGANITILNRTPKKAQELSKILGSDTQHGGLELLSEVVPKMDIIINTTTIGMEGTGTENQSLVPKSLINKNMVIMDVVGKPKNTKLILDAQSIGAKTVYGYRMLLWQGVYKFKLYTGIEPPIEVMEDAMEKIKDN